MIKPKVSRLGAEPKKVALLGLLLAVAGYFFISNWTSSDSNTAPGRPAPTAGALPPVTSPRVAGRVRPRGREEAAGRTLAEFRPSLLKARKEVEINRAAVNPTLRLDLLDKLEAVKMHAGSRSLFDFDESPAPAANQLAQVKEPPKIHLAPVLGPPTPKPPAPPAPPPPPPRVPLKFYGFVNPKLSGDKRAFFLDGEDIIVAKEGQIVKNRYKIVRIGVNQAVVQDTQFENHESVLPLEAEQTG